MQAITQPMYSVPTEAYYCFECNWTRSTQQEQLLPFFIWIIKNTIALLSLFYRVVVLIAGVPPYYLLTLKTVSFPLLHTKKSRLCLGFNKIKKIKKNRHYYSGLNLIDWK